MRAINHRRWATKFAYAFFGALPALILALNLALMALGVRRPRTSAYDLMQMAAHAAAGPLLIYLFPHLWVRSARKNMAKRHQGPHEWTLTPGRGIDTRSPGASASHSWSDIQRAFESRYAYILQLNAITALVLPKRALDESEAQLRHLLRAELGPRARLAGD